MGNGCVGVNLRGVQDCFEADKSNDNDNDDDDKNDNVFFR